MEQIRTKHSNAQFCQKIGWVDRFGEQIEVIALRARRFQKVGGRRLPREEQYLASRLRFAEVNRQLDPSHTGHGNVSDKQIRSLLSACGDGVLRMIEGACLETCLAQYSCERLGDHGFIIHNEDYAFSIWHLFPLICPLRIRYG